MSEVPGALLALGAGLLSFLSPCVLPLIPGYLSFISGTGAAEAADPAPRRAVLARTTAFVLGFTAVFTALGMVFGGGILLLGGAARAVTRVSGIIVILLGLNILFDFLKFLNIERRVHPTGRPRGLAGAFLIGAAFGAGWTPCVGPILASILIFAGRRGNPGTAAALLAVYSLGLALPFLAAGAYLDRMKPLIAWFHRRGREVRAVSGLLLVLMGLGILLGQTTVLTAALSRAGHFLAAFSRSNPEGARATALGAYGVLAALSTLPAILRGRPFVLPPRLAVLAILAALALGEVLGWWAGISILSDWLLFQGV
ncbi:MAG TPA: cytochrome c biogenesis protein CcdA [Magnetospirillaceae bacterium]|nr:cytochrome c biogenesis protein CcdA [Magnetospirillaceae bacterium]